MTSFRLCKISAVWIFLLTLAAATIFRSSFQFNPDLSGDANFIRRAQHKEAHGIKVSASALSARESAQSFGENLAGYNIQPVWLSIENETDEPVVFFPITMDPDYYSPYEVSYKFHGVLSFTLNHARDEFFLKRQIANVILTRSKTTGFAYGVLDNGIKYAHIVIAGNNRVEIFDFALPVPGPAFVGTDIRADNIYLAKKIEDLAFGSLKTTFEKQVCCTTN
jgi:hypothetical protein